jgi:hypothetical protein
VTRRVLLLIVVAAVMFAIAVVVVLTRDDDQGTTPRNVAQASPTLAVPAELPTGHPVEQALTLVPLEDDVDWEARWTGPDGAGYALRFRDNLDRAAVQSAVDADVGELAGATVRAGGHLVVEGEGADRSGPPTDDGRAGRGAG